MKKNSVNCNECGSSLEELTTLVRERIGCAANCSGKMVKKTISYKCNNCGKTVNI